VTLSGIGYAFRALHAETNGQPVVVVPHLEGTPRASQYFAGQLGAAGFDVLAMIPPVQHEAADLAGWRERLLERTRATRSALEWTQDRQNDDCVSTIGLSLGGVVALPAVALSGARGGVVLIASGADLDRLLADSQEIKGRVRGAIEPGALSILEPADWAKRLEQNKVMIIEASFDRSIPKRSRDGLREAFPDARYLRVPTGHYTIALAFPLIIGSIADHLRSACG
jgi:hypothetical protein